METIKSHSVPVKPRHHVLAFVALKHAEQKRKYTFESYLNHLRAVAEMADGKCEFGFEIGLCHDLFEDTDCTYAELLSSLWRFGYENKDAVFICDGVSALTDRYTPEEYPDKNRKARKELEAIRLSKILPGYQTVKYCDLINNTASIVQYDPGFAVTYLEEKREILAGMNKGHKALYKKACALALGEIVKA